MFLIISIYVWCNLGFACFTIIVCTMVHVKFYQVVVAVVVVVVKQLG